MYWKILQPSRISLVVLIAGFLLTACDWGMGDIFPDMPGYKTHSWYYGKVVNNETQEPICDAKIICNNKLYESNSEGYYEIKASPEDFEILLKVSKEGYEDFIQKVSIKCEEAQELNISLIPAE